MARQQKETLNRTSNKSFLVTAFALTLVIQIFAPSSNAQTKNPTGCEVLDQHRPSISIDISAEQSQFKKQKQIGFNLENNTTCTIHVVSDGDGVGLRYEVQSPQRSASPSHRGYWTDGHMSFFKEVKPGEMIKFGVAEKHAKSRLTISLSYIFDWEIKGTSGSDFEHRVYFDSARWPRTL